MEKEFVPYELAVKLKELGFNKPCLVGVKENNTLTGAGFSFTNFNNNIHDFVLPLWQQAFDWIRSKEDLHFIIEYNRDMNKYSYVCYHDGIDLINWELKRLDSELEDIFIFDKYEGAREACLVELIKLIEEKK